jgi:3-oxoacyl-[acyl-carrier-protein] synthase III
MITLRAIASYLPNSVEENSDRAEYFNFASGFLENKLGVLRTHRKAKDEETSDMCVSAFHALVEKTAVAVSDIDCIVVCTQNPDENGMPQSSALVHRKLGARDHCAAFDISLACSGYVYGLSTVKGFMEQNGLKTGLLFTCDPYSKILDREDRNTSLLFGDAATVSLLASDGDELGWKLTRFRFSTFSAYADDVNNKSGFFQMNGQGVYAFAVRELPGEVAMFLDEAKLAIDEIDYFVFHQGSKFVVDSLAKRMRLPIDRVPVDIVNTGNTVSSSIPLILESLLNEQGNTRMLLSGFGVGISVGTGLIEKIPA